ncbi:MAG: DUF1294 domain-containing protein [Defluviitaleaceae bacterium]|nr:DUF1294 domain-containing protein [Defluviitaleaceae bacterium]
MNTNTYIILALVLWNIITLALYGADKRKAKKNKWRISEATLILYAFLLGALGAMLGMSIFRHKTTRWKFKILIPIAFILNIAIISLVFFYLING